MSHILNGCKKMKNNYTKRHDHILEKISSELKHHCEKIYVNKTIKTAFPEFLEESTILNLKPDIVMKMGTDVSIIDIACPYDLYIESTYQAKLEKYRCIKEFLSNKEIECSINAIIIGSLGTVHNQALKLLLKHQMKKEMAKGLLKWCSTGNIICAKNLWNLRCKLDKEV